MPQIAGPQCYVEIFPFEGGNVAIDGRSILSCRVQKNLRDDVGTFEIILPPLPGPLPSDPTTWTEAITPMSLCLIAMTRGDKKEIVMVGVVSTCSETQHWSTEHGVIREICIAGQDLAYYFMVDNWAALTLLLPIATSAINSLISQADLHNNPSIVAANWYNKVMAGPEGVNAKTIFPISLPAPEDGVSIKYINFSDAMAQWFEDYPNVEVIPFGDFFFASEGNWFGKFRRLLTYPVYEFFVMTAPSGAGEEGGADPSVAQTGSDNNTTIFPQASGGFSFTMNQLPGVSSSPYVIARINPIPAAIVADGTIDHIDFDRWSQLPQRWPETGPLSNPGGSFLQSTASFSVDEAKNFYMFNSQALSQMFGQLNSDMMPLVSQGAAWFDSANIHRYGYKPFVFNTSWLYDGFGLFAQDEPVDIAEIIGSLLGRVFSYYHPTPLMLRATVTYPLRPDIFPSMRFSYAPFKDNIPWQFYVEGVDHQFEFGGKSTTTLSLSRGLPASVYDDPDMMEAIISGNAMRVLGKYQEGVPPGTGESLAALPIFPEDLQDALREIAGVQFTAQGK